MDTKSSEQLKAETDAYNLGLEYRGLLLSEPTRIADAHQVLERLRVIRDDLRGAVRDPFFNAERELPLFHAFLCGVAHKVLTV